MNRVIMAACLILGFTHVAFSTYVTDYDPDERRDRAILRGLIEQYIAENSTRCSWPTSEDLLLEMRRKGMQFYEVYMRLLMQTFGLKLNLCWQDQCPYRTTHEIEKLVAIYEWRMTTVGGQIVLVPILVGFNKVTMTQSGIEYYDMCEIHRLPEPQLNYCDVNPQPCYERASIIWKAGP